MKDTDSNPICYSRQLHGTYRLVNEKDEEKYNMTFYNGCPADIPWRGGNIDDIEIKKVSGSALKTRSKLDKNKIVWTFPDYLIDF